MSPRLEAPEDARARLERATLDERERVQLWRRIADSASAAPARLRARRVLVIAVPALMAAAAALWLLVGSSAGRVPADRGQPVAAVDGCALDARALELALPAGCGERALHVDGDEWLLAAGTRLARRVDGPELRAGRVRFAVHKRAPGEQFRVRVSHGEVRVVGTVFMVEQHDGRGSVTVREGVIEFVWNDGQRERVAAGQTLHWPRQKPPAIVPPPIAVTAVDAGAPARASLDLDRVLERLLQLRSQRREGEAVTLLRTTLKQPGLGVVQRERISYELGLALEASGQPACVHWQRHIQRFGSGSHDSALAERIVHCREH
jgi:ferric-dicitrate binding protein FerR (iron transport regulator)